MKKLFRPVLSVFAVLLLFSSCRKNEAVDISTLPDLGGDTWVNGPIDQWILDSLTTPYNIDVRYKYDEFVVGSGSITQTLVPIQEAKVIPALSTIKRIWISTYEKEGGSAFIKQMVPKEIALIGSLSYHNGSVTLGEAEGNNKILLYNMNNFSDTSRAILIRMMHTVEHEFGHILNHSKLYDASFKQITPGSYTSDWNQIDDDSAHKAGFVTPYSMSAPDEDFVETLATMLVDGKDYFEALVAAQPADAQAELRAKQNAVVAYMKSEWNIDFTALQTDVAAAINALAPAPIIPLSDVFGFGKTYSAISADSTGYQTSGAFVTAFETANDIMKNKSDYISNITLSFQDADTILLNVTYYTSKSFAAYYRYPVSINNDGSIEFGAVVIEKSRSGSDGNADSHKTDFKAITDFFDSKTFVPKWPNGKPDDGDTKTGGLYLTGDESTYVLGTLSN